MLKRPSPISLFAGFALSVFGAIIFNIGGLFAGRSAVFLQNLKDYIPWIFLIYPLLLTVRGDINGILTGKLGTALHLGTIYPSWKRRTDRLYQLIGLLFFLSVYDSILIGCVTSLLGYFFKLNIHFVDFLKIVSIALTTFVLTSILSISIVFSLTFFLYRRKKDPDVYAYPLTSSLNDIIITLIFVASCWIYQPWQIDRFLHFYLGIPIIIITLCLITLIIIKYIRAEYFKQSFFQSIPALTFTNFIAAGTGSVLAFFSDILIQVPVLIVFYPAILSTIGDQSIILANTTTTKLHLGSIKPSLLTLKTQEFHITYGGIIVAGIIFTSLLSIIGFALVPKSITLILYFQILAILVVTNILSYIIISTIALSTTFITYRIGLDPDSLVNPLLSSTADLITTSILVLMSLLIF
jgi:mgtE-like transporter